MEDFVRSLGACWRWFEGIVILSYLPVLTRPENLVHFFRDVHAADALSASIVGTRLEYWTLVVGSRFSKKDRQAVNRGRHLSLQQVEYAEA